MRLDTRPTRLRGDPSIVCALMLLLGGSAATALAHDGSSGGTSAAESVARVATRAVTAPALPDDPQTPPDATDAPPVTVPPQGFLSEPRIISRGINFANRTAGNSGRQNNGFYPEFSNMITGAGWISAGPGYRQWLFTDRAVADASAAISWRSYKMAQARFEFTRLAHSRLALGSQVLWQDATQVTYFGIGSGTPEANRSEYRMKTTDFVGYATIRPAQWLSLIGRAGWLQQPTLMSQAGTFKRGNPDTVSLFAHDIVYTLAQQPSYVHGEAAIVADTRDSRSHPLSGGVYRYGVAVYSDRGAGTFSFQRYEAEAAQFVPLAGRRVVLAVHGWLVGSATGAGRTVPFYLMPSLGGGDTIRAYTDFRFHDRNLLVVNAESRIALFTHIDLAAFVDAGNVAPRLSGLDLDKRAYGVGLRLHSATATFARVDVAHGAEGWRILLKTNDPLHLSRLSRRTAAAPFVP